VGKRDVDVTSPREALAPLPHCKTHRLHASQLWCCFFDSSTAMAANKHADDSALLRAAALGDIKGVQW